MKHHQLPAKASEYITKHFPGSFLCEVTHYKDVHGHLCYRVEISQDEQIYHLKFNEHGGLITRTAEEAFPEESAASETDENG